jgi:hypothetical protein
MPSTFSGAYIRPVTVKQSGPDPAGVRTPEEFVELLRHVRGESGLSFWDIQARAYDHGYDLEPAAVVNALGRPTLPDWQIVVGLLTACGFQGMQIDRWMRVYHALAGAQAQPYPDAPYRDAPDAQGQFAQDPVVVPPLPPMTGGRRRAPRGLTYRHGLYLAAAVALVAFAVLIANMWGGEPDPVAAPAVGPQTPDASQTPAGVEPAATPATAQTTPAAPPARTTAPPAGPAPGVLRSGTVTLASGQGVDLDTGQPNGDLDIVAPSGTALATGDHVKRLMRMSSTPSRQTCESLNAGQLGRDVTGLAAGQWLCVRTSTGRWARVNVTATGTSLKLAYTVWT